MNTLAFIPGSDIPGATGLVNGHIAYDQATETYFYSSCVGAPAGCTLAGNGQPYVGTYGGIINPAPTSGASWTVSGTPSVSAAPSAAPTATPSSVPTASPSLRPTASPTAAPSVVLTAAPSLHPTASPTAAPSVALTAAPSLRPTASPTAAPSVVLTAAPSLRPTASPSVVPSVYQTAQPTHASTAAASALCKKNGAKCSTGKGTVTATGLHFVMVKQLRIEYAACTEVEFEDGVTAVTVGAFVEWEGYITPDGSVMARELTFSSNEADGEHHSRDHA